MDKYGPLYRRNGTWLWPRPFTITMMGIGVILVVSELVLGILSVAH